MVKRRPEGGGGERAPHLAHCHRTVARNRALPSAGGLLLPPPGPAGVDRCQEETVRQPCRLASEAQRCVFRGRGVFSVLPSVPGRYGAAPSPEAQGVGRPGVAPRVRYVGTASDVEVLSVSGVRSLWLLSILSQGPTAFRVGVRAEEEEADTLDWGRLIGAPPQKPLINLETGALFFPCKRSCHLRNVRASMPRAGEHSG